MDQLQALAALVLALAQRLGLEPTWPWFHIQAAILLAATALAYVAAALLRRRWSVRAMLAGRPLPVQRIAEAAYDSLGLILFAGLVALARAAMLAATWPGRSYLLGVAVDLALAWVAIILLASQISNRATLRTVATLAWSVAALSILGQYDRAAAFLDSLSLHVGAWRISVYLVLKATALLAAAIWAASTAAHSIERSLLRVASLTPSLRVLIGQISRVALFAAAGAIVLNALGIDLSALLVFSGALGVGLGFGMQKIVANFVSGIILLADRSIKPGDVIGVAGSFGSVATMGARYCSVVTRDGREFLIPNEQLVTETVVNWSHSSDNIRIDVPFGVAYASDPHQVRRMALEALAGTPRVLAAPAPVCHLTAFGDSSLDFVLRFWISDPAEGVTNVRGIVLLKLWDIFKREGVSIPFPVRDLHIAGPLQVVIDPPHG